MKFTRRTFCRKVAAFGAAAALPVSQIPAVEDIWDIETASGDWPKVSVMVSSSIPRVWYDGAEAEGRMIEGWWVFLAPGMGIRFKVEPETLVVDWLTLWEKKWTE